MGMGNKLAEMVIDDALARLERRSADEGPFPETVVHMHLDGTSQAYIRANGPELQATIDRAVAEEREACALLTEQLGHEHVQRRASIKDCDVHPLSWEEVVEIGAPMPQTSARDATPRRGGSDDVDGGATEGHRSRARGDMRHA